MPARRVGDKPAHARSARRVSVRGAPAPRYVAYRRAADCPSRPYCHAAGNQRTLRVTLRLQRESAGENHLLRRILDKFAIDGSPSVRVATLLGLAQTSRRPARPIGDGMLSTFDSPARAIRCALDMIEATRATGLEIRAGVHTGEVERRGEDVAGLAVHIGARVVAQADAGEVLVSAAVPPLVVGAGLDFADRGEHDLKGVPGTWRLFGLKA